MNLTQCEGWLCLVILEGCSKYCGKGIATSPCIILKRFWSCANDALENESKIAKNHLELEKMEVILNMQYCELWVL